MGNSTTFSGGFRLIDGAWVLDCVLPEWVVVDLMQGDSYKSAFTVTLRVDSGYKTDNEEKLLTIVFAEGNSVYGKVPAK